MRKRLNLDKWLSLVFNKDFNLKKVVNYKENAGSNEEEMCCTISDSNGLEVEYCFLRNWKEDNIENKMISRIIEVQQYKSLSEFEARKNESIILKRITSLSKRIGKQLK